MDKRYRDNLSSAIEVMSAIVEGYESGGDDPDASLANYITIQKVGKENIPAPLWELLSGFVTMNLNLLAEMKHATGVSEQGSLDIMADAVKKMTPRTPILRESNRLCAGRSRGGRRPGGAIPLAAADPANSR